VDDSIGKLPDEEEEVEYAESLSLSNMEVEN
jgi:hypothetical protein